MHSRLTLDTPEFEVVKARAQDERTARYLLLNDGMMTQQKLEVGKFRWPMADGRRAVNDGRSDGAMTTRQAGVQQQQQQQPSKGCIT